MSIAAAWMPLKRLEESREAWQGDVLAVTLPCICLLQYPVGSGVVAGGI